MGSRLVPAYRAHFDRIPTLQRFTGDEVAYSIAFRLAEALDVAPLDTLPTYRDFPVLEMQADWSSEPEWAPDRDVQVIDYGFAAPTFGDLAGEPRARMGLSLSGEGRAGIMALIRLLYLLKGRAQPVWLPSLGHDLRPVAGLSSGGNSLDVATCGLVAAGVRTTRRDLRIELRNGTVLYRRIASVASAGAGIERLTLDATWPATVALPSIARVSFLTFARQDTDANLLRWWSHELLLTDLVFVGIVDDGV